MIRNLKIKIYYLILVLALPSNLFSQQNKNALIPYLDAGKFGFSAQDGKIVIPPKFDFAFPFYPGYELTMVTIDKKPFLINRKGKKVFEGAMDYLKSADFSKLVIQPLESIDVKYNCLYNNCPEFKILVNTNSLNLFDRVGDLYLVTDLKKVFLIDSKGKQKSEIYDRIIHYISTDYEYCITIDSTINKKGLLDTNGNILLQCTYDQIIYQGQGVFTITDNNISHDYKVAYKISNIQDDKNTIGSIKIIRQNSKLGVIDSVGNITIPCTYDRLYPISGNKFLFVKSNYTGIMDENEVRLFEDSTTITNGALPYYPFNDSLIFFEINHKFIMVDINGKKKDIGFDGYYADFQKFTKGIAAICENNKIGIIDKSGTIIIPVIYDEILCSSDNQTYIVRTDKKWSWLNKSGKVIFDGFDKFSFLIKNYLFISKFEKWYFIDTNGLEFTKK